MRCFFFFVTNDGNDDDILEVPQGLAKSSGTPTDQIHGLGNGKLLSWAVCRQTYFPESSRLERVIELYLLSSSTPLKFYT